MGRKKGSLSPFSIQFQMEKYGLTEEEARFKVRSFKNICKEYWIVRGYSEDEAINEVKKIQQKNGKIAAKKRKEQPFYYSDRQTNQLGYWLKLGYSEEEAKQKVYERQQTFSLKKCIEKYGEKEGKERFEERQKKWQASLKNHSSEFIEEMNKNKNVKLSYIKKYGEELGILKYNDFKREVAEQNKQVKKDKKSGKWFFEKYKDENEAKQKWQEWLNKPTKYSFEWFLEKFNNNEEIAKIEFDKFIEKKRIFGTEISDGTWYQKRYGENWKEYYIKTFGHCGLASKISIKFFILLYKILRTNYEYKKYDILFGIRGLKEHLLYDKLTRTRYLYDFTVLSDKLIIEFNGDGKDDKHLLRSIHPNYNKLTDDELLKWRHPYRKDLTAKKKIEEDLKKIKFAEDNGFKVLTIWQSDGNEINLKKCLEFIDENGSHIKKCC